MDSIIGVMPSLKNGGITALDLEIILDPFKEDFKLPALFVNSGNARCR